VARFAVVPSGGVSIVRGVVPRIARLDPLRRVLSFLRLNNDGVTRRPVLVAVVIRLVGPLGRDAQVGGLIRGEFG
jgi:hypothetical protein